MLALLQTGMKPREERRRVLIQSRMRVDTAWADVCIHNISSRGILVAADVPPARGTYVDIRRGTQVIIGRVMWSKGRFFGVRSQDRLPIEAIIAEPRLASRPVRVQDIGAGDRRSDGRLVAEARAARRVERSRELSSAMQFVLILVVGGAAAIFAAMQVYQTLSRPFAVVEATLAPPTVEAEAMAPR